MDDRLVPALMKRFLDAAVSLAALVVLSPLLLLAAIGIKVTSPGPVFYRAKRIARDRRSVQNTEAGLQISERRRTGGYWGREFTMYKLRTMRMSPGGAALPITAGNDPRVFPFGRFLRATKIDEIPQLFNVLRGDMSLVGPRPEAPEIVHKYYTADDLRTLQVPPGVTSPGTVYYYTHCEERLAREAVVDQYVKELLPAKLALDRVYLQRATTFYDVRILLRTIAGIAAKALGSRSFPDPPEMQELEPDRLTISKTS